MAFQSSDGKQFSMLSRKSAHERGLKSKLGTKAPGSILEAPTADQPMTDNDQDAAQVHAEHGPAHSIQIEHKEEEGQHHVHSKHEDGYEHHAVHSTKAEAHDAARELAGADQEPEMSPEGDYDLGSDDSEGQ